MSSGRRIRAELHASSVWIPRVASLNVEKLNPHLYALKMDAMVVEGMVVGRKKSGEEARRELDARGAAENCT